jgi:hypothetical protein
MAAVVHPRLAATLAGVSRAQGMSGPDREASIGALATATAALTLVLVVAVRLVRLDDLPGEWYGDISTLYEYALSARDLQFPAGLYYWGVGPLYPLVLSPLLALTGGGYLVIKLTAVAWSLAGLAAFFWLCFRLGGAALAGVATLVAGTGSWLLVYSRLGDVEAAVPFFTVLPLAIAVHVVESRPVRSGAILICGVTTGASLYLYGAAFAVPMLIAVVLAAACLVGPRPRLEVRRLAVFLVGLALALLPMSISFLRSPQAFAGGHFATRLVRGPGAAATVTRNFGTAMKAYVTEGDRNARGNPARRPHLDRLSFALAIAGVFAWATPGRRRWGAVIVFGFLVMHLPAALAREGGFPSASRTIGAAPYAYFLVASGVVAVAGLVTRRFGKVAGVAAATALLGAVVAVNLDRYFRIYAAELPYQNTPVARRITDYVDRLPSGTTVYLVGSAWAPGFMPEPKSILYAMRDPDSLWQIDPDSLDCAGLASLSRPAVLIWSYRTPLPSPGLAACAGDLAAGELFSSARDLPLFHAAALREGSTPGSSAAPPRP